VAAQQTDLAAIKGKLTVITWAMGSMPPRQSRVLGCYGKWPTRLAAWRS
jgi:hypothetical protein